MAENQKAMTDAEKKALMRRIMTIRASLLRDFPFYGTLLMRLKFAVANCGTAATDMNRIYFDPAFAAKLTDAEMAFVMIHEVMHCVLDHIARGKGKNQHFFNIAADIVVNSNIMLSLGKSSLTVAGEEVMHLAPDGSEGHLHSAEEVYAMLLEKYKDLMDDVDSFLEELENEFGVRLDNHDIWQTIPLESSLSEEWKNAVKNAVKVCGSGNIPQVVREYMQEMDYQSKLNWRSILQEFIQLVMDRFEYTYRPSNKRVLYQDMILPAYRERYGEMIEQIWFVLDTSGSISANELSIVFAEVRTAINQIGHLKGMLSFFDTTVTDPIEFDSVEELDKIEPSGGGGTSFTAIFKYMHENMEDNLPKAVIVLTDGFSTYPPEEDTLGVPVLWIVTDPGDDGYFKPQEPPWGRTVHLPLYKGGVTE